MKGKKEDAGKKRKDKGKSRIKGKKG